MESLHDILNGSEFDTVFFKKGTIIQRKGDVSTKSYFVKKGLLRSFTLDEKGKEHIFMFAPENSTIADIETQDAESLAELYIDVLEDANVVIFDRNEIDASKLPTSLIINEFTCVLRRIGKLQRRIIMHMSAPARTRYEHFLEIYPQIVNRIPQRMIASYLGITPEALSKLRGDIARNR